MKGFSGTISVWALCVILSAAPLSAGTESIIQEIVFTGGCALFFERGHYWIELALEPRDDSPAVGGIDRRDFTITDVASGESFNPSRVEIVRGEGGRFVVLSSGRLKGRRCFDVSYDPGAGAGMELGSACDPAGRDPSPPCGRVASLFRDHVAPAFSAYGEEYRFNKLSIGYDFTSAKTSSELLVEPVFGSTGFSVIPYLWHDATTYRSDDGSERSASRMRTGIGAAARRWTGPVRLSLEGEYSYDRESQIGGGVRTASSARTTLAVRFDNLFDAINRHGVSVFKGIDAGAGYAWYDSTEEGGGLSEGGPLLAARLTWTLVSSLQFSLGSEVCWPGEGGAHAWNRARIRLLLRDALARPAGRSYHPDLELAVDWGRRMPFFEREQRVTLGFTFDLYPW